MPGEIFSMASRLLSLHFSLFVHLHISLSSDSTLLVTGTSNGWIILYSLSPDFREIERKPVHSKGINDILFSVDQRYILTCSDDATAALSRTSDLTLVKTYNCSLDALTVCDISKWNDQIISAGLDTMIHIWAATASQQLSFMAARSERQLLRFISPLMVNSSLPHHSTGYVEFGVPGD
jgi:WD40 repeat protein